MAIKVKMTIEKETKRTYRYAEDGVDSGIRTLYIRKSALPTPVPTQIEVTVTSSGEEAK